MKPDRLARAKAVAPKVPVMLAKLTGQLIARRELDETVSVWRRLA